MKIVTEITLDLSRQGIQCSVPITQHDAGTRRVVVHLRNGSKPVILNEHDLLLHDIHNCVCSANSSLLKSAPSFSDE